jgi:hypothetical protein
MQYLQSQFAGNNISTVTVEIVITASEMSSFYSVHRCQNFKVPDEDSLGFRLYPTRKKSNQNVRGKQACNK